MPERWVLISGATSGIGEACAAALISDGFHVLGGYRKKRDAVKLRQFGARMIPVELDVTRPNSVRAAATFVRRRCGRDGLYGLVNNAGVTLGGPLEAVPVAQVRQLFEVNVFGMIAVTQAMLPLLRLAPGRIINIGSLSGLLASPFLSAYCASKAALESLCDALRIELAPWGIEVSLIEPGATASRVWEKTAAASARLRRAVPRASRALYGEAWDRVDAVIRGAAQRAELAARVGAAVHEALVVAEPSTRYPLDNGETMQMRALPDRERDQLLLRAWQLPGRR